MMSRAAASGISTLPLHLEFGRPEEQAEPCSILPAERYQNVNFDGFRDAFLTFSEVRGRVRTRAAGWHRAYGRVMLRLVQRKNRSS